MGTENHFLFLSQFKLNKHPGNSKLNTLLRSFNGQNNLFYYQPRT